MEINQEQLDKAIKNGLNVLLQGEAGTGKTTIILGSFMRNNLKFKYFSAATMDPFLDFVGMPKEKTKIDPITGETKSFIGLVLPEEFADDEVEAIFLDEFNRAHKKVRNAAMELIQFKSINGRVFKNLKVVCAAINPDTEMDKDSTYDVEPLDKAQRDRFQVVADVPFRPNYDYFSKKYSAIIAEVAIQWWKDLPEKTKKLVSPRRLDYAVELAQMGIDLRFVLHESTNPTKLQQALRTGPIVEKMDALIKKGDKKAAIAFIQDPNNYYQAQDYIKLENNTKYSAFFLPLVNQEAFVNLIQDQKHLRGMVQKTPNEYKEQLTLVKESQMKKYSEWAASLLQTMETTPAIADLANYKNPDADPAIFVKKLDAMVKHFEDVPGTVDNLKFYTDTFKYMPSLKSLGDDQLKKVLLICETILMRHSYRELNAKFSLIVPIVRHLMPRIDAIMPKNNFKTFVAKLDMAENSQVNVNLDF